MILSILKILGIYCLSLFATDTVMQTISYSFYKNVLTINEDNISKGINKRFEAPKDEDFISRGCYSKEEFEALLRDADAHVKEYKETHEGWL